MAMCSRPLASDRSVPGTGCRCRCGAARRWRCAAGRPRCAGRRARGPRRGTHGRRHRVGRVAADEHDDVAPSAMSSKGNGSPRSIPNARWPRRRPTTCRTGRCSRCCCAQRDPDELAELVGLLVGQAAAAEGTRRRRARARPGCGGSRRRSGRARRPSSRAKGGIARVPHQRRRSAARGWSSSSAAVAPLMHRPPRLTGNPRGSAARPRRRAVASA